MSPPSARAAAFLISARQRPAPATTFWRKSLRSCDLRGVRDAKPRGTVRARTQRALAQGGLLLLWGCSKADASKLSRAVESDAGTQSAPSASQSPEAVLLSHRDAPLVDLSGRARPASPSADSMTPRLYSRAMRTWIYEGPSHKSRHLGYLRAGSSVVTSREVVSYDNCRLGWHRVEPAGFVCLSRRATLDKNDPIVLATRGFAANPGRKLPYIYGTVRRPGPMYGHLPTAAELDQAEPGLAERLQTWFDTPGETGASYAQEVWLGGSGEAPDPRALWTERRSDELPPFLQNHANTPNMYKTPREAGTVIDRMRSRAGYAFTETIVYEGRRYGVTPDLKLLPVDRLRPIRGSEFHGVEIGKEIELPFAFIRRDDAKFWAFRGATHHLENAGNAPYRAAIKLTGKQQFFSGRLHFQTHDGLWVSDRDASRIDPARRMPAWGKNGEKWLDVNITKQTVVLYQGAKPVYATLISTGEAGLEDPKHSTATKRGIFRIHTKHLSTTMSSDEVGEEFELREVPYVQYFDDKEGYALHGAYWHDRFGTPKSHGCINLAPEDARRIFYFTEPQLPSGWHGVLLPLKGTVMFVHP